MTINDMACNAPTGLYDYFFNLKPGVSHRARYMLPFQGKFFTLN